MTDTSVPRRAGALWIVLLVAASMGTTWALACMTPFAALAALAATHLRARDGLVLMLAAWAASQAVGFGVLHYPHDPATIAWGVALGLAALGAAGSAYGALGLLRIGHWAARLAVAFAAAFVGFKLVLIGGDVVLGGPFSSTVAPALLAVQVPREAAVTLLLLALYRGLVAVGVPAAPAPASPSGRAALA